MEIPMIAYLVVSTIMFFAGVYGFVTRKNMLAMLISLELMLNAVDINFVVFNRYLYPEALEGFFFTLFAIGIAAAQRLPLRSLSIFSVIYGMLKCVTLIK
jgi:NADH:ubiquinone oxidoreductase subunit K